MQAIAADYPLIFLIHGLKAISRTNRGGIGVMRGSSGRTIVIDGLHRGICVEVIDLRGEAPPIFCVALAVYDNHINDTILGSIGDNGHHKGADQNHHDANQNDVPDSRHLTTFFRGGIVPLNF